MAVSDLDRFKKTPASGSEAGNQSVVDSNLKVSDVLYIPTGTANTFNGGKIRNGALRQTDGVIYHYYEGEWLVAGGDLSDYYTKQESDGRYIFASPETPQIANINLDGEVKATTLKLPNITSTYGLRTVMFADLDGIVQSTTNVKIDQLTGGLILSNLSSDSLPTQVLTRDPSTGKIKYLPSTTFNPLLISGTTIKTINGINILGSGNIDVSGGSGGATTWGNIGGNLVDQTDLITVLNNKQNALTGTGFVKSTGGTISYDNSTYLTTTAAGTTYEPIFTKNTAFNKNFGTAANTVTQGNDSRVLNGQTAFGWGNHATAGYYLASNPSGYISTVPAQSFASLTGKPTTLGGYGITDAYPLTGNPSGFLTSSYNPPSQVQNSLLPSSNTLAPSISAVNKQDIYQSQYNFYQPANENVDYAILSSGYSIFINNDSPSNAKRVKRVSFNNSGLQQFSMNTVGYLDQSKGITIGFWVNRSQQQANGILTYITFYNTSNNIIESQPISISKSDMAIINYRFDSQDIAIKTVEVNGDWSYICGFVKPNNLGYVSIGQNFFIQDAIAGNFYDFAGFTLINAIADLNPYVNYGDLYFNNVNKYTGKKIVRAGDSIFADPRSEKVIKEELGMNVVNLAYPGSTVTPGYGADPSANASTLERVPLINAQNADVIFINAGTNDYGYNVPLGVFNPTDTTTTNTFYGAYNVMIRSLIQANPKAQILVSTPLYGNLYDENLIEVYKAREKYVNAIIETCNLYGIPVLDKFRTSIVNMYNYTFTLADKIHPTDATYDYLSRMDSHFIQSPFGVTNPNINTSASGTINSVPKFTSNSILGNSLITDNGATVSVSTNSGAPSLFINNAGNSEYQQVAAFYAPNNSVYAHNTQLNFGVNNGQGNSTEWRYKHFGGNSEFNSLHLGFSGYVNPIVAILNGGRVGIMNVDPTEALDVIGKIKTSSLTGTGDRPVFAGADGILKIGTSSSEYVLPTASATVLGGIKVGSGLAIDGSGILSATGGYVDLTTNQTIGGNKTFTGFSSFVNASTGAFTLRNNTGISTPSGGDVNMIGSAGKLVIKSATGTIGFITPTSATLRNFTFQNKDGVVPTLDDIPVQARYTASGNGASTAIVIAHGLAGLSSTSTVIVTPNNMASSGISFVTIDATNVTINYSVAPPTGTNNLIYSISIK